MQFFLIQNSGLQDGFAPPEDAEGDALQPEDDEY